MSFKGSHLVETPKLFLCEPLGSIPEVAASGM